MRRREFIKTSAFATAGVLSLPSFMAAGKAQKSKAIGLQLYSLRDSIPSDPKGVLEKVGSFGYKELETYGHRDGKIFGMPIGEFGAYVKSLGMKVTSGHYGTDLVQGDALKKLVDDAKKIGQTNIVVPSLPESDTKSLDSYKKICAVMNKAGEICNQAGIRFGYHNHAFEFNKIDDQIPYDLMLKELDPKLVSMEMDIYWVVNAGYDPIKYFEKHPGRFEQWHVKDMDKADKERNADIGTGTIDWKSIFAKAKQSGMKHFYIEQESYPGAPIDSIAAGVKYLKTIL